MFVRHKTIKGIKYYYLCRCKREGDKVIQEDIAYLGIHPTINDCLDYHKKMIPKWQERLLTETRKRKRESLVNQIGRSENKIKEIESLLSVVTNNAP